MLYFCSQQKYILDSCFFFKFLIYICRKAKIRFVHYISITMHTYCVCINLIHLGILCNSLALSSLSLYVNECLCYTMYALYVQHTIYVTYILYIIFVSFFFAVDNAHIHTCIYYIRISTHTNYIYTNV